MVGLRTMDARAGRSRRVSRRCRRSEVCRRIREWDEKREVFVLFLIGRDKTEVLERVLDAGGDEFILKPTTPEDLRARLIVARRRMAQDAARRTAEAELSKTR